MNVKEFVTQLREAIRSIKEKQGVDSIKCDNLIAYLDQIINAPETQLDQTKMGKQRKNVVYFT